ncbi:(2Fe-2S)-binding protein [Clostridium cylindrosporum]|uniref:BFD-like [2Fe-2S]-binding domain-containing protein n=1 Tax=Clostridium cylindrosporum DSM 605 TaxID=1121307 RepID=A0A0J8DBE3_CLOCY|nr:(2Fe-2S)-binding protein [Clostridium cylindrosporum]KMT21629.1 hypothetical protein CLCY_2c03910 [Clostridium cylindrosporum DSM 605]
MGDELREEVLDKLTKVCVCTGTSRRTIKEAVKKGALTFQDIKAKTGAGSGSCCGRKCREKIEQIISSLN